MIKTLTHSSLATPIADKDNASSSAVLSLENVMVNVFAFVFRTKRNPKLSPLEGSTQVGFVQYMPALHPQLFFWYLLL
jgi:hypothetical protein